MEEIARQRRPERMSFRLTFATIAAIAAASIGAAPAAAGTIGWDDFEKVDAAGNVLSAPTFAPSGEDRIRLLVEHNVVPSHLIEIRFQTAPWITWWKGIEVHRAMYGSCWSWFRWVPCTTYELNAGMYLQDTDHGPVSRSVWVSNVSNARGAGFGFIRFGKAKLFGIHTGMYDLNFNSATAIGGTRYTFTWIAD